MSGRKGEELSYRDEAGKLRDIELHAEILGESVEELTLPPEQSQSEDK